MHTTPYFWHSYLVNAREELFPGAAPPAWAP